jgi:rhodanese-related sulfurtransferase
MDGPVLPISPNELYARLGTAAAPLLIDVRHQGAFGPDARLIIGALYRSPENLPDWQNELAAGGQVVVYCSDGRELGQQVAGILSGTGVQAFYLEGGITGWQQRGFPTRRKVGSLPDKWVTREHPKIDRIACPWLILRFINPKAEFIYVPPSDVLNVADKTGATPYDIKGVDFGHVGDHCSFDAIVRYFDIHDAALDRLATIVRGADTSRPDLAPQCHGLLAISYGLSANFPDDHAMLAHGLVIYDALYSWCRLQSGAPRIAPSRPKG